MVARAIADRKAVATDGPAGFGHALPPMRRRETEPVQMDALTAFGLAALTVMLFCYMLEDRSPWWTLGFALCCVLSSLYGFLQGAWPFGLVEILWAIVAGKRWWNRVRAA